MDTLCERDLAAVLTWPPLSLRADEVAFHNALLNVDRVLSEHLLGVCKLVLRVYGADGVDAPLYEMLTLLREIAHADATPRNITAKRAVLMYTLCMEQELVGYFEHTHIDVRALQACTSMFQQRLCHDLDTYILMYTVLRDMWL